MKKRGGEPCVHVNKHMYTRGVWGHAPPENFRFQTVCDCFGCIFRDFVLNDYRLAISKGGRDLFRRGGHSPPLNKPLPPCILTLGKGFLASFVMWADVGLRESHNGYWLQTLYWQHWKLRKIGRRSVLRNDSWPAGTPACRWFYVNDCISKRAMPLSFN